MLYLRLKISFRKQAYVILTFKSLKKNTNIYILDLIISKKLFIILFIIYT